MKNGHPVVTVSTSCSPVDPDSIAPNGSKEPIIRLKLDKPLHWDWELTTTADALPVIQLLDKDGRLLVETTGRTAQRARGSFREGLKCHEEFGKGGWPSDRIVKSTSFTSTSFNSSSSGTDGTAIPVLQGNRIVDGLSTKFGSLEFGFAPRKSRSDASVKLAAERRTKKRHSTCSQRENAKEKEECEKDKGSAMARNGNRYSVGDFLRRQILDDLRRRSTLGKSPEEIAKERCRKVKAYLRSQSDILPTTLTGQEASDDGEEEEQEEQKDDNDDYDKKKEEGGGGEQHTRRKKEKDKTRRRKKIKDSSNSTEENNDGDTRDSIAKEDRASVVYERNEMDEEKLRKIKNFLSQKLREKMREEKKASNRRNGSGNLTRSSDGVKKRHSDRGRAGDKEEGRKGYRTRKARSETSVVTFAPEVLLEREKRKTSRSAERENSGGCLKESPENLRLLRHKVHRRSRSDDRILEHPEMADERKWRIPKRNCSSCEKRKVYRKTKSDLLFGRTDGSLDSEKDLAERSWREYKERKRLEKLHRDAEKDLMSSNEEDFMKKPRWKDLQKEFCFSRNCKVCANSASCVNPWRNNGDKEETQKRQEEEEEQEKAEAEEEKSERSNYPQLGDRKREEEISSSSSSRNGERPGTSLQENYLYVDPAPEECRNSVAKVRVKDRKNVDHFSATAAAICSSAASVSSPSSNLVSPDFGYNSIPKSIFKDYRDLYARSNVKKSDTFKIVDGNEDPEERRDEGDATARLSKEETPQLSVAHKSNEDIAKDYFKRVYELLKRRQEEARRAAEGIPLPGHDDSSSSNYVEEVQQRRPRRKRKDVHGEEIVAVPLKNGAGGGGGGAAAAVAATTGRAGGQDTCKSQRLRLNNEEATKSCDRRRRSSQFQNVCKRTRATPAPPPPPLPPPPPPPPPLISCKINAKDIGKYFDWPNKENTPRNGVNFPRPYDEGKVEEERRRVEKESRAKEVEEEEEEEEEVLEMGSNLSRHNGKGLTGRRTQSSGNLCEPKGKFNGMGRILVPCSNAQKERRYKFCGSLPNHLDDKDALDDDPRENNNTMTDTMSGNLGGTLPHKKRSLGVHFSDGGPTGALDLVKHRSQDSLDENDPWRYQQSDLDLVRCRHGNFDSVRRNRSVDTVASNESTRRHSRGVSPDDRCQRNSDLDLVGTLPKRRQDHPRSSAKSVETNSSSSSSSQFPTFNAASDDDLLMRVLHKPDCELMKHRQQLNKCADLKLSSAKFGGSGGEPQDQGYASERSPEDEHPPSLPGQPFPTITSESTFRVTLQKSSRGLGLSVSGGGTAGPVRVKRLFPQQPAALSNKLQPGDILLAANGVPLTGLTNYEALEVLRTTPSTVELVVCRLPGDTNVSPPGNVPPPPPARREPPPPLRIHPNPLPPLQIEPCGEFDIEMTKVGGSLGFTLRKADSSALGHYVRALVREPALSDGRIRPGDKIVAVDGAPLSPMSHEEAVALLRQCGPKVKLRLYRDLAQTPVSALSPTEPDHPLRPPRTCLRQEAVDMLCDLAVRKLSPGASSGSSCKQSPATSCNSPRRHRRLATRTPTAENDAETPDRLNDSQTTSTSNQMKTTSDSDQCSIRTQITNSQANTPISGTDIIDPPSLYDVSEPSDSSCRTPTARPSFLDLSAPQGKPHFQFCSADSDMDYPSEAILIADRDSISSIDVDFHRAKDSSSGLSTDRPDNDPPSEPASMPPVLSSTSNTNTIVFSYKNPAYQSANPACGTGIDASSKNKATHSSDQDIPGKILGAEDPGGSKGLLKWKGVMFAPNDDGIEKSEKDEANGGRDITDSAMPHEELEQGNEVFMVELTRGWNSRLGFSLQPEGNHTVISVVHPDSVAARDGRLKQGDVLLMVNDESVESMSTAEIIDLLRKIRGSIGITVMRRTKRENAT